MAEQIEHAWYVADEQRYCTRCGVVQTGVPGPPPQAWTPEVPPCTGAPPSSAAELEEAGTLVGAEMRDAMRDAKKES